MTILKSAILKEALISGFNNIFNNKNRIDALNVFPVPDGDTGSNMVGTTQSAVEEIEKFDKDNIGLLAKTFYRGALLGARGNSGVILSQIFKGFSEALQDKKEATIDDLVKALIKSKEWAYKSVMNPIEGTILTVIRMISEEVEKADFTEKTIVDLFELIVKEGKKACDKTPDFLPILKEVGVNDSGGEGLLSIFEGMHQYLIGNKVEKKESSYLSGDEVSFISKDEIYDGNFGFCTELIISLKKPNKFIKENFRDILSKYGNSIVIVQDDEILKVHVHALKPGSVLNASQKYGDLVKIKIDNMTLQANQSKGLKEHHDDTSNVNNGVAQDVSGNKIAVISCNNGQGIIREMKELGANFIIEGGQSNNPSAKDFIEAVKSLNTNKIIILPNNSNIILVAQQIIQTFRDKEIIIIPTKTQAEGIIAMINFDPENSLQDNQELITESLAAANIAQITTAVRDTKINGIKIKKNNFLGILDNKIFGSESSRIEIIKKILDKCVDESKEIITIWYGDSVNELDAKEIADYIESNFDLDYEIKNGGQKIYDFLISIE